MIRERYFLVGDGPLAERFYELLRHKLPLRDAMEVLEPGFQDRACIDGISFIYKPNIVEIRGHLVLYVPDYEDAERTAFKPPDYLIEIKKWQVYRLRDDGVLDLEEAA